MAGPRRKSPWVFLLPLLVVGGAVGVWLWQRGRVDPASETPLWTVARGPLRITVTEGGSLQSLNPTTVSSQVKGETKIVAVVAEGTYLTDEDVAAGRVIVELDKSNLEEKLQRQVVTVSGAESDLAQGIEALKIQQNQNDSDLRKATLEVQFARIDLQKYVGEAIATRLEAHAAGLETLDYAALSKDEALEGEGLQERRKRESEIDLAREEVARARDKLKWTEELLAKGYVSQDEHVADKLALKRNEVSLEQAQTSLALFLTYEFKKQVQQLVSDLREAKEELGRVERKAASSLASAQADVKGKEDKLRLEKGELERIETEIASCTIRARNPGLVVYASSEERGGWMSEDKPIQPGATIRERQPILSIPDPKALGVRINVHESALAKVKTGHTATVTVDAFPDKPLAGKVDRMGTLPNSANRWQNPDLKLYATDVLLENPPATLRPGMSARVEILIEELASALFVPSPAVTIVGGKPTVYVRTGAGDVARPVTLGASNDRYVEVKAGLEDGDVVLLAPPKAPASPGGKGAAPAGGARGGRR
ncbi:MAG: HlyD family efflux transporter periplasmic adaptor subunit, partial [Planctomycetia bacterium]|nr:HlyD family efflux transporter periplasmic adaptor subunit [Planctomycetia bacterium]